MKQSVFAALLALIMTITAQAQSDDALSTKEKYIAEISAFTATGETARLKSAINEGLDNGLAINEIKEVMVQMYAYCGFPRSLNALNLLMNTVDERKTAGKADVTGAEASPVENIENMSQHGEDVRTALVGRPVTGKVYEFCPVIDEYLRSHLFGDIFARDNISHKYREIATVGALAAMNLEAQLRSHLSICRNLGYTEKQLREFANVMTEKVGAENGATANRVLDKIFSTDK